MQNSRVILVLGDMHDKIWDMIIEEQTKLYPDDSELQWSIELIYQVKAYYDRESHRQPARQSQRVIQDWVRHDPLLRQP